jgi:hypothetical protein
LIYTIDCPLSSDLVQVRAETTSVLATAASQHDAWATHKQRLIKQQKKKPEALLIRNRDDRRNSYFGCIEERVTQKGKMGEIKDLILEWDAGVSNIVAPKKTNTPTKKKPGKRKLAPRKETKTTTTSSLNPESQIMEFAENELKKLKRKPDYDILFVIANELYGHPNQTENFEILRKHIATGITNLFIKDQYLDYFTVMHRLSSINEATPLPPTIKSSQVHYFKYLVSETMEFIADQLGSPYAAAYCIEVLCNPQTSEQQIMSGFPTAFKRYQNLLDLYNTKNLGSGPSGIFMQTTLHLIILAEKVYVLAGQVEHQASGGEVKV